MIKRKQLDLQPKSRPLWANIGLFYAAAVWGSTFFVVKRTLNGIDPVILVAYRFIIATAILAVVLPIFKKPFWKDFKSGIILGIFLWILYLTQTIGMKYTSAANSGLITGLFVAFVPFMAIILFKNIPSKMAILATLIAIAGLWLLTGGLTQVNIGDIITLISAIAYAVHILFADKFLRQGADPYTLSFQQFLFIAVASLLTGLIFHLPFTISSSEALWMMIFLAIFPSLTAFSIQLIAQRWIPPIRASLILAFEPVFAVIFAWTLGGESYSFNKAFGGLLIFTALLISGIPSKPIIKANKKAPAENPTEA